MSVMDLGYRNMSISLPIYMFLLTILDQKGDAGYPQAEVLHLATATDLREST